MDIGTLPASSNAYTPAVCMIMGYNNNDGFPVALVLVTDSNSDHYVRVSVVAIDTRMIPLSSSVLEEDYSALSDVMGEIRTLTIV